MFKVEMEALDALASLEKTITVGYLMEGTEAMAVQFTLRPAARLRVSMGFTRLTSRVTTENLVQERKGMDLTVRTSGS